MAEVHQTMTKIIPFYDVKQYIILCYIHDKVNYF